MIRRMIVTHHAPDLDAIGAVWMLKRFDAQHYADAKVAFVDPGSTLSVEEAAEHHLQPDDITHVDTGLGIFDHHQPERGHQYICATSLVYDHVCTLHPELADDQALQLLVGYITETDHLGEIHWPEPGHYRYELMLHELVRGVEDTDPHNDDSQLYFGLQCLDCAYANLKQYSRAQEILKTEGTVFTLPQGKCLAIETRNDDVVKLAQKQGFVVVIRKDPTEGHIRIKARPDVDIDLKALADAIKAHDTVGTWYYHPSGKMLINGSRKHRNQTPSPLSLQQTMDLMKAAYAT